MKSRHLALLSALILLAGTLLAQTQAAPVTPASVKPAGPLTQLERDAAIAQLKASREKFLASIQGLSEAQWTFKLAPERWSVAEVAEHITVAEGVILGLVTDKMLKAPATPENRVKTAGKDEQVLKLVPDRTTKVQAPEMLKPTGRWATEADLTKTFEQERENTINFMRTTDGDLRDHIFTHPLLGDLDAYQWVLLISAHSERHTKQIEEVKADPNFPKK